MTKQHIKVNKIDGKKRARDEINWEKRRERDEDWHVVIFQRAADVWCLEVFFLYYSFHFHPRDYLRCCHRLYYEWITSDVRFYHRPKLILISTVDYCTYQYISRLNFIIVKQFPSIELKEEAMSMTICVSKIFLIEVITATVLYGSKKYTLGDILRSHDDFFIINVEKNLSMK